MLNNIGLPGLLLIAVVVLVMFGKGKVSSLMGEVGKGITETLRLGLESLIRFNAYQNIRKLKGKVKFSIDLKELRKDK